MNNLNFFSTTALYKEYKLLIFLSKNPKVTQRELAEEVDLSLASVNIYLERFINDGFIEKIQDGGKNYKYVVTKLGNKKKENLSIDYLKSALNFFNEAKLNCNFFFNKIRERGYKNILLYGAGEVCEMLLLTLNDSKEKDINVLAIIDDDIKKIGRNLKGKDIITIDNINCYRYDAIMIATYTNNNIVYEKLLLHNVDKNKIVQLF